MNSLSNPVMLPRTTYRPPSPQGRRRPARGLNPIMEEDERLRRPRAEDRTRNPGSSDKIQQWLSPTVDGFPTPRGQHFLPAPILPSDSEADLDDDASSQASSSIPSLRWNPNRASSHRDSVMTDVTEFDDLYDVSDDEITRKKRLQAHGIGRRTSSRSRRRSSRVSTDLRRSLAPLVIPAEPAPVPAPLTAAKKLISPVPPTPPSAVVMSPAVKEFMERRQTQEIPRMSAPPSLDGSINSEEMAHMSAPPTPSVGSREDENEEWSGVQLQPGALETLRALAGNDAELDEAPAPVIEVAEEVAPEMTPEMTETRHSRPPLIAGGRVSRTPSYRHSLAELTRLEIPSPGGFFSELSSASRRTWNCQQPEDQQNPPTSTTAENFYKIPWSRPDERHPQPPPRPLHLDNLSSAIVEHVIELPPNESSDDLPTAIRVEETPVPTTAHRVPLTPKGPEAGSSETAVDEPTTPIDVNEIIAEYAADYAPKQEESSMSHIDRTAMWLAAQRAYLQGVAVLSEDQEDAEEAEPDKPEVPSLVASPEIEQTELVRKKTVRFSDVVQKKNIPCSLPSKLLRQESSYYRAFTDYLVRACATDVFVHRQMRFEALQAQRVCLRDAHRNQLLGKFQLSVIPQSAKKRMSANVVRGDDVVIDDPEKLRADKEAEALYQMRLSAWQVAATKMLNGGQLIMAPIAKRLARQSLLPVSRPGASSRRDRTRILDLGGQGTCDWAWHAALQYPNAKIYTVTTKAIRQLSNSNIRGPPNHRQVAVKSLAKLPFADDQFDIISARELHAVLKASGEHGLNEWDACLRECMRVLKPGGYLDFSLLDAAIMNAGPLGNAKAVEFNFALQTLGYDPNPTRSFLPRLAAAGFTEVRRAWLCLPLGPKRPPRPAAPVTTSSVRDSTSGASVHLHQLDALVTGSAENIAAVTAVAAGWSWERWLLRAEMEKVAGELRLADTVNPGAAMREAGEMIADVHAVVDEGRERGSCWRVLKGYARKPFPEPKEGKEDEEEDKMSDDSGVDVGAVRKQEERIPEFPVPPTGAPRRNTPSPAPSPAPTKVLPPVPARTMSPVSSGTTLSPVAEVPLAEMMAADLDRSGSIRICLDTESLR
ncbi:hypothetical protein VTJ83DRAFT_5941 [Remersonia thermophila]|uniref:Methyltransferase type 11 domain-containing protein n=1 Tax=Remersonia thermophila TaxID=72144 RepID=A0ABR4D895_9PEZI